MYDKKKVEEFRKEVREYQKFGSPLEFTPGLISEFSLVCVCLFYQVSELNPMELLAIQLD